LGLTAEAQIGRGQFSVNTEVFQKEFPKMVTNTDLLVSGERLHYAMYNLSESGKASLLSKISYVSLRTAKDSVIFSHKLKLENGLGHGTFFIPTSLKSGIYSLFAHTNFSLNNAKDAVAYRKIYIINPYITSPINIHKDSTRTLELLSYGKDIMAVGQESSSNGITLKTDKLTYMKREQITLGIENSDGKLGYGSYVLSVRRLDPLEFSRSKTTDETIQIDSGSVYHIPELRGEILTGRVVTIENKVPVANKVVALSIPGKNYVFKMARTDTGGHFYISIDESYDTQNCIIQIDEPNRDQYEIIFDKKDFELKGKGNLPSLKLDPNLKDWLQERSIQLQIENAYFSQNKSIIGSESENAFYGDLGTEFVLDDYTRFPSIQETFIEVVSLARIRNKGGKDVFEVFDPSNPYKTGPFSSLPPLLLLDGILVQDAEDILSQSANEIGSIRVFPQAYRYGPKVYQGIIDLKTKRGTYEPYLGGSYIKEFELISPLPAKKLASPDHSDGSYHRLPDYRTQLFWEPNINLLTTEMSQVFYASDVTGTYAVTLKGYTLDGKYVMVHQRFIVE
jgi:hypothetical protein